MKQRIKIIKSDSIQNLFILILLFVNLAYFGSRGLNSPGVLVLIPLCAYFSWLVIYRLSRYKFFAKLVRWSIVAISVLVLGWSLFFDRLTFADGENLYLRNVYLIMHKGYSGVLQGAILPYLSELMLGLVGKILGFRFVLLSFGVFSLINVYTTYLLYKKIGLNSFVTKLSLLNLAFSPTYIILSLIEFKVELFLLFITNLFFLLLIGVYRKPSVKGFMLLGFLSGVGFLIKLTALPLSLFGFLLVVFLLVKGKVVDIYKSWTLIASFFCTLALVITLWFIYTPTNLLFLGTIDIFNRNKGFIDLERNQTILKRCFSESSHRDISSWIYFENELWLLIQPLQYLFLIGYFLNYRIASIANPGIYMYFGIWLLPFVTYLMYKKGGVEKSLVYISCLPFVLITYFLSKTMLWYLFPAYPIIATVIPILADRYLKTIRYRNIFKFFFLILTLVHIILGLGLTAELYLTFSKRWGIDAKGVLYGLSKEAQRLSKDHYIMDATQHLYLTYLPFMDNYDEKLVKSNFYFVSSGKSTEEMRRELLNKNIKYIIARKDVLFDDWYTGCLLRNNEILFQFLNEHTKMVYDSRHIGEIYEILD